jgi:hypothetical protein
MVSSRRRLAALCVLSSLAVPLFASAQSAQKKREERSERKAEKAQEALPGYYGPQPAQETLDLTMYARIRDEGLRHSHVMEFAG